MPTTIEIKGDLEKLAKLVLAGQYATKSEAVRDAVRHLLASIDMLDVAVSLYKRGKISVAAAAHIAGVSLKKMVAVLTERGISPRLGVESKKLLEKDYKTLRRTQ